MLSTSTVSSCPPGTGRRARTTKPFPDTILDLDQRLPGLEEHVVGRSRAPVRAVADEPARPRAVGEERGDARARPTLEPPAGQGL